eukprot:11195073-Lingulodinium_polyedra.AAC.1
MCSAAAGAACAIRASVVTGSWPGSPRPLEVGTFCPAFLGPHRFWDAPFPVGETPACFETIVAV